jgi:predicted ATP-binding protein involved in virulence
MSYPISSFFDDDVFRISVLSNRSKSNSELSNLVRSLDTVSQNFKKPLFVYYRQDRTFEGKLRRSRSANIHQDELEGDLRAISDLENWWDNRDAEEARAVRDTGNTNFRDPQLQAIRALIQKIDAFEDVRYSYDASRPGLYFSKTDGQRVHISKLSGGERSYIILLADLARRLQISQPDIDLADIPGIILIDEIELNLHPSWQSEVIITLCEVFKSCQFVVSTHSPQVISAVESEKVRILKAVRDGIIEVDRPLSTHGRSSNYLLEGVFGASERLPKVDQMINNFNTSIEIRNLDGAERMLEEISKEIEGSATELLVLKKRLKKLKGLK